LLAPVLAQLLVRLPVPARLLARLPVLAVLGLQVLDLHLRLPC
jgi:hypothetical protein